MSEDLTAAYMAGMERGKEYQQEKIAELEKIIELDKINFRKIFELAKVRIG